MTFKIAVKMNPVKKIIRDKGMDKNGRVQLFHTTNINRRIGKYMSHLTGTLETKLKMVADATHIEVMGPYAKYHYYGKVMVGPAPKVVTDRDLTYTKTFNPMAGPFWDRRLLAAEQEQIAQETTNYLRRFG